MASGACPRCQQPLNGQVKLCGLCGTTYHAACLRDTRDCVLCSTRAGIPLRPRSEAAGLRRAVVVLIILAVVAVAAVALVLLRGTLAPVVLVPATPTDRAASCLDALRLAILRSEAAGAPLGDGLPPALAGTADPWGRPVLVDTRLGVLASFGRDGVPGGTGEDQDVVRYFRRPAHVTGAEFDGAAAPPRLTLRFSKPVTVVDGAALAGALMLDGHPAVGWTLAGERADGTRVALVAGSDPIAPPARLRLVGPALGAARFGLAEEPTAGAAGPSPVDATRFPGTERYGRAPGEPAPSSDGAPGDVAVTTRG